MKRVLITFLIVDFIFSISLFAQPSETNFQTQKLLNKGTQNFFIENKGQWPKEVRYLARIGGMNAWITNSGVVYDYYQITRNFKPKETQQMSRYERGKFEIQHSKIKGQVVDIQLESVNTEAKSTPSGIQEGYYNYFIGNDTTKWASFVRLYNEVLIEDIYPGIDIRYYFDDGLIRYDYIAKPGADLSQINLKIMGSDGYSINKEGELTINTSLGNITHGKLYGYQQSGNGKTEIACSFIKKNKDCISVYSEEYNPGLSLVIDPLIYSTFIGGTSNEQGNSIVLDGNGNAFITGYTSSHNYPTTIGAYDTGLVGTNDIFVTKLNVSGSAIVYSTFIGGNNNDWGNSIAIDGSGNAFIAGYTLSTNYPTTTGAYKMTPIGGEDIIVTKLNASGTALVYSTYIGGNSNDECYSIAISRNGNAFITGNTTSSNYPTTTGAYNTTYNGKANVFVTKLNALGSALVYSTFIEGGTSFSIAVDSNGNAFLTGFTQSTGYPTTPGAYNVTQNGGQDVFVTKLNTLGTGLVYSTFIGGSGDDYGYSLALDVIGNVFITGYTNSTDYPTTTGAYDTVYNGFFDVFVTKLNNSGTALIYSTYIGGSSGDDYGYSIAIDCNENAFVTGYTNSTNYPIIKGAYDTLYAGNYDVFISKLNTLGSSLLYSTYIGGNQVDYSYSIANDGNDNAYITGYTTSTNYPTTKGAYKTVYNGDVFVTKIPTINPAGGISFTSITSTSIICKWKKGGGVKRILFVKQTQIGVPSPINNKYYTANDTFGLGSQIGSTGWYCIYNDTGSSVGIIGLSPGGVYRVMVCEYIGTAGNEIYNPDSVTNNPCIFTTLKSIQSVNINFSNYAKNSITVSWTHGNCPFRVVFVCAGNTGTPSPSNNTTYIADTTFGLGTQIGSTGWYCVLNGAGIKVNISGLAPNTTYRVMVCESYLSFSHEQYITSTSTVNPRNYYPIPTTQAYNISFSNLTINSMKIKWSDGNGSKRAVFVRLGDTGIVSPSNYTTYSADTTFGKGKQAGISGWYCVYNGIGSTVTISGLFANTTYRVMVCEYNGLAGEETYNVNSATNNPNNQVTNVRSPTIQASGISFSNVSATFFNASWFNGNGTSRVVFIKATTTGTVVPSDYNTYTADTVYGFGSQIDTSGWYCVYNGTGSFVSISNLTKNTTYCLMVLDYNGTPGYEKYDTNSGANNPNNQTTNYAEPDTQASGIIFSLVTTISFSVSWTKGSGTSRVVFINATTAGKTVTINNNTYFADTIYGYGSQISTTGWYCVYNDTGSSVNISNLNPGTTYRLIVFDYNGPEGYEIYDTNIAANNPNNQITDYLQPSIQSSKLIVSNITYTGSSINCTKGNGSKRAFFIKSGNSGKAIPINHTFYTADTSFGSGTQIGSSGWFCVYNDTGSAVNITNLLSNTTYRVMACEYNGPAGDESYNIDSATNNPHNFTTLINSIEEINPKNTMTIFPNPFKESTTVKMNESFARGGYTYILYDCTGKVLFTKPRQTTPEINIQKGELTPAIYFLEIDGMRILRTKLMIVE